MGRFWKSVRRRASSGPGIRAPLLVHALRAAAGASLALVLGAGGFGLGCLYAGFGPAQAAPVVARATPAGGVGGPEEPAPPLFAALRIQPARALPPASPYMFRPVVGGWISSRYGRRLDPFTGQAALHRGMDFAGLDNSVIVAAAAGVVTWSGGRRGYGNLIEIDHGNGLVTRYGHNAFNLVSVGDYVKPGQTIALMGATGRATGTHLHFEVLDQGRQVNPARYVDSPI